MAVGKDEVPSSNLGSSSKIPLESIGSGGISLVFVTFWVDLFLRFSADPYRDPHGEMSREGQRVPESARQEVSPSCLAFLLDFSLYMTCAMKFPIVSAARFCCCRVAWV